MRSARALTFSESDGTTTRASPRSSAATAPFAAMGTAAGAAAAADGDDAEAAGAESAAVKDGPDKIDIPTGTGERTAADASASGAIAAVSGEAAARATWAHATVPGIVSR